MFDANALSKLGWKDGDGNASYLDKTVTHHGMEVGLDDRVGIPALLRIFFYAIFASILSFFALSFLGILIAIGAGAGAGAGFMTLSSLISVGVFWVVLLGGKLAEPISEWRVLLDGRTDRAGAVYQRIEETLETRAIPLARKKPDLTTDLGKSGKRLVLRDGTYIAYVSVFSYGTSLYLGWMMWRSRRGSELIKRFVTDLLLGLQGRNDTEVIMLRTEEPRAMREAVHAACREGLVVAIEEPGLFRPEEDDPGPPSALPMPGPPPSQ